MNEEISPHSEEKIEEQNNADILAFLNLCLDVIEVQNKGKSAATILKEKMEKNE